MEPQSIYLLSDYIDMAQKQVYNGMKTAYSTVDGATVYDSTDALWAAIEAGAPMGPYIQIVTVQALTYDDGVV